MVALGGNDLKSGVPSEEARHNLRIIIESIQNQGALVIVGGIDFPCWGKRFGEIYKQLSKELEAVLIPNALDGIIGNRRLMSDRIHPNNEGYTVMAQMFYEAIKPYV